MSGNGSRETCCPELWDRINELEALLSYTQDTNRIAALAIIKLTGDLAAVRGPVDAVIVDGVKHTNLPPGPFYVVGVEVFEALARVDFFEIGG